MNIFVTNTTNSDFYLKPDSSLVKESFDFYRPDDAQIIQLSVCVAFKSIRSAKFINKKFAHRVYETFTPSIIIYPKFSGTEETNRSVFKELAFDKTFVTSNESFKKEDLEQQNILEVLVDGVVQSQIEINKHFIEGLTSTVDQSIENISKYCSIKTGDYIAIELNIDKLEISNNSQIELRVSQKDFYLSFNIL